MTATRSGVDPSATEIRALHPWARALVKWGQVYEAFETQIRLRNKAGLRAMGWICLRAGLSYSAERCFEEAHDREGLAYLIASKRNPQTLLRLYFGTTFSRYLGQASYRKLKSRFLRWVRERKLRYCPNGSIELDLLCPAYDLARRYDVVVGIARGGLVGAFYCSVFGLPVLLATTSGRSDARDRSFCWHPEPRAKSLTGKRVLVSDLDVVTGRTARLALDALRPYRPKRVDLLVALPPIRAGYPGIGSIVDHVPPGYGRVHHPAAWTHAGFPEAVTALERWLAHG